MTTTPHRRILVAKVAAEGDPRTPRVRHFRLARAAGAAARGDPPRVPPTQKAG